MLLHASSNIWVVDRLVNQGTLERLGDARVIADRLHSRVCALVVAPGQQDVNRLIAHGADVVHVCVCESPGPQTRLAAALSIFAEQHPQLVLMPGDAEGRAWAARLAAVMHWQFVSPALMVQADDAALHITALDRTGQFASKVVLPHGASAVVTLKDGVAQALPADVTRRGEVSQLNCHGEPEAVTIEQTISADPHVTDIRFVDRLVAGGRGLGGRQGFETLAAFADKLHAGVAASRMAVDLGWIKHERQVGQTGKTVKPSLYIACGISGASHHLEGMSDAKHIVAINTDADAPIFKVAHLGLVADLYDVIRNASEAIDDA